MPKKVRELKAMLRKAGFAEDSGRGSHVNFWYPGIPGTFVTVSGNDGDDARRYHEKHVAAAIARVRRTLEPGSGQ
jgi:predicted RNA binding protein YcfA (HicA-like mRNA interferase family)